MRSGASVSLAVASYKVSARAFTLANAQPNVSQTNKESRVWQRHTAFGNVNSYNQEHRHSAIHYVTPDERHYGCEHDILARRHQLYQRARRSWPMRWTRNTRNWTPVGSVLLNPQGVIA